MNYYFDVTIKNRSHSYAREVEQLLFSFHGAMKCYKDESPIAIAFPKMQQHVNSQMTSFGDTVRFIGHKAILSMWLGSNIFDSLESTGSIKISPILPVPETDSHVIYRRDYSFIRHRKNGLSSPLRCCYPTAYLKSSTNGHNYSVSVRLDIVDKPQNGSFSSFGLGAGEIPGSVPFF